MSTPLDQNSEVVDQQRRWTPDWYTWLIELAGIAQSAAGLVGNVLLRTNNLSDVDDAPTAFDNIKQTADETYLGVVNTSFFGRGRFHVHLSGIDQGGGTANAYNRIIFSTIAVDADDWFNTSTGRFTPQEPGWYWIYLSVAIAPFVTVQTAQAAIYRNGAQIVTGFIGTDVGLWSGGMQVGILMFLDGVDDFVEGFIFLPPGITTVAGAIDRTYMSGWRVGS